MLWVFAGQSRRTLCVKDPQGANNAPRRKRARASAAGAGVAVRPVALAVLVSLLGDR